MAPKHRLRFKNKLYSLDASLIDLSLKVFPWAHYALGKAAMKLHIGLDHDGYLPAFAMIAEGRVSDMDVARTLRFAKSSMLVFDDSSDSDPIFGPHLIMALVRRRCPALVPDRAQGR